MGGSDCHICEEYGVHVAVFRRNERNMRRGFHNLYRFYPFLSGYLAGEVKPPERTWKYSKPQQIEELNVDDFEDQNVLVISSCSKTKETTSPDEELPVDEMHQGRLFQRVRTLCERTGWDHRIISAKFGLLEPGDVISGYNEKLGTKAEADDLWSDVLPDLAEILHQYDSVFVIAGKNYRRVIEPLMDHRFHILNSAGYPILCSKIRDATPTELQDFH